MSLRIGFFSQFNYGDIVLLVGTAEDIRNLLIQLRQFSRSSESHLPVHKLAAVSSSHPAQLFAVRSLTPSGSDFRWLCSGIELSAIEEKLGALAALGKGHHYFHLIESEAQLLVSVGEYDASWWEQHG
jgi:hypothetical protein